MVAQFSGGIKQTPRNSFIVLCMRTADYYLLLLLFGLLLLLFGLLFGLLLFGLLLFGLVLLFGLLFGTDFLMPNSGLIFLSVCRPNQTHYT